MAPVGIASRRRHDQNEGEDSRYGYPEYAPFLNSRPLRLLLEDIVMIDSVIAADRFIRLAAMDRVLELLHAFEMEHRFVRSRGLERLAEALTRVRFII